MHNSIGIELLAWRLGAAAAGGSSIPLSAGTEGRPARHPTRSGLYFCLAEPLLLALLLLCDANALLDAQLRAASLKMRQICQGAATKRCATC